MAYLVCLFTNYELYGDIDSDMHLFPINALHCLPSVFLQGSLYNDIMPVSLLTLVEILKCMNDQAQHVNMKSMPYGTSKALYILMPDVKWALGSVYTKH